MQPDTTNANDVTSTIENIVHKYFKGLHFADIEMLESLFSPDCVLKSPNIRRTRDEWLDLVRNRLVPAIQGDKFGSKILSIEIQGDQAMVKAFVPLLGSNFIDYLGLLRENDTWLIVNKMYADHPEAGV